MSERSRRALPIPKLPVERFQLGCGATLLVSSRAGAPVVAAQVQLEGAFASEPAGRSGVAHLVGALSTEGTRSRTEEQLADALEPHGGSLGGDSGGLSGAIAAAHWPVLVDALCEVTREPSYPAKLVARRRAALVDRLRVEADDPRLRAARAFRELVYGDHWLGRAERGEADAVESIERRELTAHHRRAWCARRATLAVCGDVDPERVRDRFERRLAGWNAGTAAPELTENFPAPRRRVAVHRAPRQQVHLYLGHLGMRRDDPDYAAVAVLDHVLGTGSGFTNRIGRRLRDEEGLAYSVYASQHDSAGRLPGMFSAYIGTSPANLDAAVRGLVEEIVRIRTERVPEDELSLARDMLIGSYGLGFERSRARVQYMLFAHRMDFGQRELEDLPRRIARVSADDVLRVAQRVLRPDELCLAGGGPLRRADLAATLDAALGG